MYFLELALLICGDHLYCLHKFCLLRLYHCWVKCVNSLIHFSNDLGLSVFWGIFELHIQFRLDYPLKWTFHFHWILRSFGTSVLFDCCCYPANIFELQWILRLFLSSTAFAWADYQFQYSKQTMILRQKKPCLGESIEYTLPIWTEESTRYLPISDCSSTLFPPYLVFNTFGDTTWFNKPSSRRWAVNYLILIHMCFLVMLWKSTFRIELLYAKMNLQLVSCRGPGQSWLSFHISNAQWPSWQTSRQMSSFVETDKTCASR